MSHLLDVIKPREGEVWQEWVFRFILASRLDAMPVKAMQLPVFSVANLPKAAKSGMLIFISDEVGGATPAFSDGTDWRRVADRAIVASTAASAAASAGTGVAHAIGSTV